MTFAIKSLETTARQLLKAIDEHKNKINNKEYIDDLHMARIYTIIKRMQCDYEETVRAINVLQGGV